MTVVTPDEAAADLDEIVARFERGEGEPVVFGDSGCPQGVVVPYAVWVYLLERLPAGASLRARGA
jgi:hypothetical protein